MSNAETMDARMESLSVRAKNCLRRAGISSPEQLSQTCEGVLLGIPRVGTVTIRECSAFLKDLGLPEMPRAREERESRRLRKQVNTTMRCVSPWASKYGQTGTHLQLAVNADVLRVEILGGNTLAWIDLKRARHLRAFLDEAIREIEERYIVRPDGSIETERAAGESR